jgi:hypothetical protein
MRERPEEIERLEEILRGAGLAHEVIFDLHRRLLDRDPSRTDSLELVAESARIVTVRLPRLTAGLRGLAARWDEESLFDPAAADRTAELLARELQAIEPLAGSLTKRQVEIAAALSRLAAS